MYTVLRASARPGVLQNTFYVSSRKWIHGSSARHVISNFAMPAMSPTMTEGGIASWKKKEGESFSTGDILLEIETDKATIDVEAQDDGIVGKIIAQDGAKNISVGKIIALLAEEGDDISNLEAPREEESPSPKEEQKPSPTNSESKTEQDIHVPLPPPSSTPKATHSAHEIQHSQPLFPSVLRLLLENNITDADKIKGTGVRGMLTKGDVLAFLGKASSPTGTYKEDKKPLQEQPKKVAKEPLDAFALRKLIVTGLAQTSKASIPQYTPSILFNFDSIISDYLPSKSPAPPIAASVPPPQKTKSSTDSYFDGLI